MGDILSGRKRGTSALCGTLPFLEDITGSIKGPDTPRDARMRANVDRGMAGRTRSGPGRTSRSPIRKARGQKELSPERRAHNCGIDSERAIIENQFRRIKAYHMVGGMFRGSVAGLEGTAMFITGVVNLQRLMWVHLSRKIARQTPPIRP